MRKILLFFCALAILSGNAIAATTPNSAVRAQTPTNGKLQFLPASTPGTYLTLYTAGANGSRCNALMLSATDQTATHLVSCQIVNGGVKYGGTFGTTVLSGGAGVLTAQQNLMSPSAWVGLPTDSSGTPYFQLVSGDTFQCTYATAVTTADAVNLIAMCADF